MVLRRSCAPDWTAHARTIAADARLRHGRREAYLGLSPLPSELASGTGRGVGGEGVGSTSVAPTGSLLFMSSSLLIRQNRYDWTGPGRRGIALQHTRRHVRGPHELANRVGLTGH